MVHLLRIVLFSILANMAVADLLSDLDADPKTKFVKRSEGAPVVLCWVETTVLKMKGEHIMNSRKQIAITIESGLDLGNQENEKKKKTQYNPYYNEYSLDPTTMYNRDFSFETEEHMDNITLKIRKEIHCGVNSYEKVFTFWPHDRKNLNIKTEPTKFVCYDGENKLKDNFAKDCFLAA